jgi:hypothetical protein
MNPTTRNDFFVKPDAISEATKQREQLIAAEYAALRSDPDACAWGGLHNEAVVMADEAQRATAKAKRLRWSDIHSTIVATHLVQLMILALMCFSAGGSMCLR